MKEKNNLFFKFQFQYATNTTLIEDSLPERYGTVPKTGKPDDQELSGIESEKKELLPIDVEARKLAKEIEPIIKAFLVS